MKEESIANGGKLKGFTHDIDSTLLNNTQLNYHMDNYNTQLSLGITNIFDEEPPYASGGGHNADGVHSSFFMGREYYARAKFTF
jgi:outer membrane receptor protein involved in Fe transport